MFCQNCEKETSANAQFCANCGHDLRTNLVSATSKQVGVWVKELKAIERSMGPLDVLIKPGLKKVISEMEPFASKDN